MLSSSSVPARLLHWTTPDLDLVSQLSRNTSHPCRRSRAQSRCVRLAPRFSGANLPSVQVGPPAAHGEGRARRYYKTSEALVERPCEEIRVLADILPYCVQRFGDANAVGWRETIKTVKEVKEVVKDGQVESKEFSFFELSEYKWWSYRELAAKCAQAASALVATGHSKDTVFNIYSATNPRWQVMANGEFGAGFGRKK